MRLLTCRTAALAAVITMGAVSEAFARGPARTMAGLEGRISPGTEIEVVDRQGRVVRGEFAHAGDDGVLVTFYRSAGSRRVRAHDVLSVTRPGDSVLNGALIGALFGALPVIGLRGNLASPEAVSIMATYAGAGALIDLMRKGRTVVYRAPADRVSWSVTPHPVARGVGVHVALKF